MGDPDYEKEYIARKKKLRSLHKNLLNSRHTQEIYHKIMGSTEEEASDDEIDSGD